MDYLLDTNAVINYLDGALPLAGMQMINSIVDDEPSVSVITKMETLGFNFKSQSQQNIMSAFINGSVILDLNHEIVNKTIQVRKSKRIKLPDAIIAATALAYDLTLITNNEKDFEGINGLKLINPHKITV